MAIKIYIDQAHNPVNPNAGAEAFGLRGRIWSSESGLSLPNCSPPIRI